jgi:telomerase protein component 1
MPATWRTVRLFISSTFRDMHSERDYLVKVLFPDLRERLERHRVHLIDIDLRWGVTREQADNDQVLDLCLEQIVAGYFGQAYG